MREKFENLGLMYVRNFSDGLDVSWQTFFHTEDRAWWKKHAPSRASSLSGTARTICGCGRSAAAYCGIR